MVYRDLNNDRDNFYYYNNVTDKDVVGFLYIYDLKYRNLTYEGRAIIRDEILSKVHVISEERIY